METRTDLAKQIFDKIKDVGKIASEKLYDKDIVIRLLEEISKDLDLINTISNEKLREYNQKQQKAYSMLHQNMKAVDDITIYAQEYADWSEKHVNIILNDAEITEQFILQGQALAEKQPIFEQPIEAFRIDRNLINDWLQNNNYIYFANKRKTALWRISKIFKFGIAIKKTIKFAISFSFGILIELLLGHISNILPQFSIGIIAAILGYFSIDKVVDQKYDDYYWKSVQKHVLILFQHFNLYLEHTLILLKKN